MRQLQAGLHEMRRKLRWLLIDINLMRGRIDTRPEKIPARLLPLLVGEVQALPKYLQIVRDPGIKSPVYISEAQFRVLSNLVERLGRVKDNGELLTNVSGALYQAGKAGISRAQARQQAIDILKAHGKYQPYLPDAKILQQQMLDSRILRDVRKYVEKQID